MLKKSYPTLKMLLFSAFGIMVFFLPIISGTTPLLYMISTLKIALKASLPLILIICTALLCITSVVVKKSSQKQYAHHMVKLMGKDGVVSRTLYFLGLTLGTMALLEMGPGFIVGEETGILALSLASSIFLTVLVAGIFVTMISSFGLLQFFGTLLEPIMRPLYKLPGCAAVDIVTSIASSAAVDIYLTNKIYTEKLYTKREASTVATNFTVCSLGFFAVLCEIAGIVEYYGLVVCSSFIIIFIMPIITSRVPPLSRIPDTYIDGKQNIDWIPSSSQTSILIRAWESAVETAASASPRLLLSGTVDAAFFSTKVSAYVLSIATVALIIGIYTPIFRWIGTPVIPIVKLLGIPNATEIAPSILVGITEIAMPAILIAKQNIAPAASFFIVVLSTVQVIFFTESANAIIESDIPLKVWHLIVTFLVRTIIAMPMVAVTMHILF